MYQPDPAKLQVFWGSLQDLWIELYSCKVPTAAAIIGHRLYPTSKLVKRLKVLCSVQLEVAFCLCAVTTELWWGLNTLLDSMKHSWGLLLLSGSR